MKKAIGARGSWFAEVEGVSYPCAHAYWYKPPLYHDPNARPGERQWDELINAIRAMGKVILTQDNVTGNGLAFTRTAYVGLFEVVDLTVSGSDLRFKMTRRLSDLK